jgi:hypothetical protein
MTFESEVLLVFNHKIIIIPVFNHLFERLARFEA